jgi:hypothetical protein|tara:strand:+ start:289 stop:777 length:489 start_codon:yes stop_codon:yes gene_type:complete
MEINSTKMTESKPKRAGRKRIDLDLDKVEQLAAQGLGTTQIARAMGVSWSTIDRNRKRSANFEDAIKRGEAKGLAEVTNALFSSAQGGNVTAQIFYLKNRDTENWMDRVETNHTLSIGSALDDARLRTSYAPANIIEGEKVPDIRLSAQGTTDKKSDKPQKT